MATACILCIAACIAIFDQLTKYWIKETVGSSAYDGFSLFGGWCRLTYTTNTGIAFGLFAKKNALILFSVVIIFCIGSLYWRFFSPQSLLIRVSIGLQLGGAVGNILDRARDGYVTDFIQIGPWPVFNIADTAIVVGVGLLLWSLLRPPIPTTLHQTQHASLE